MKQKIGIIADSSAGLSADDLQEMNIGFCPLAIVFPHKDDEEEIIADNPLTFNEKHFINQLQTETVKTSQTTIGEMTKVWNEQLTKFEKLIFIPLSKGLSGQYNSAQLLASKPPFKDKVFVFDSNGVAIINWLLVKKAYQLSQIVSNNIDIIFNALTIIRDNYLAFILPYDLNYLKRGGRISSTAAALAKFAKLKPILTFNGTIDKYDTTRTWKKAIITTLKEINKAKKISNITLFYIIHAFADHDKITEVETYVKNYGFKHVKVVKLANVICAHTGLNTFSFVVFDLPRNDLPTLS